MIEEGGLFRRGVIGLVILAAITATPAMLPGRAPPHAQPAPIAATSAAPGLDPAVAEAVRRMASTLAGAPALTVHLTSLRETSLRQGSDQQIMLGATVAVGIRRPDRLAALVGSDRGSFRLWYEGGTATLLNLNDNVFARAAMSGDTDAVLQALEDRLGVEIPLRDMLAPDPYAALMEAGTTGVHVGRTVVNGAFCEQYALRNREVDWQIWIAAGEHALPCRLAVVDRAAPGMPRAVLDFQDWNLTPELDDETFTFAAPADAQKVIWLERPVPARSAREIR
jgi:hypothetical protein